MYWLLLSITLIPFSFLTKKKDRNYVFFLFSLIIASFLIFRFGIGVDYFGYYEIYTVYEKTYSFYTEPIFALCNYIFNNLGLSFSFFMSFISFLMISFTLHTINTFSENKIFTLFLFFTLYYSVYFESAIRAGFVITLFIYAYYNFLRKSKPKWYYLFILIAVGFHYTAIVLLLVPFLRKINSRFFVNNFFILFLLFFVFSFFLQNVFSILVTSLIPKYSYYINKEIFSRSYFTILLCFVRGIFVITLYKKNKRIVSSTDLLDLKVYLFGIYFYILFSCFSISSRFSDYFLFLEVFLFAKYIKPKSINSNTLMLLIFIFSILLLTKDILSFIDYGQYKINSIHEYSYVSVFNKEKIFELRETNVNIEGIK